VVADFDGGTVSPDAGALLLGKADAAIGLIDRLAACFQNHRDARRIEHTVRTLLGQRVIAGIAEPEVIARILAHRDRDRDRDRDSGGPEPGLAPLAARAPPRQGRLL
jgi:hypothetical protein